MNASEEKINQSSTALSSPTSFPFQDAFSYNPMPFWIFLSMETLGTIVGNAMLCWLFASNKRLRIAQNYFIISLSVSDLLAGLAVVPCEYCRWKRDEPDLVCPMFCGSVISFNMCASVINLTLIASDRYLSIKKPFKYQRIFSKKCACVIIFIGWFLAIFMTALPFIWQLSTFVKDEHKNLINVVYSGTLFGLTLLAGILLLVSYHTIVRTINMKIRNTKQKPLNPAGIKVCIISTAVFFLNWIQYCIMEVLLQCNLNISPQLMDGTYFVLMMSPCLDPFLYAYYRRDFRTCLLSWYKRRTIPLERVFTYVREELTFSKEKILHADEVLLKEAVWV